MRIELTIDLNDGNPPRIIFTNMLAITEWERIEGRRLSDLKTRGVGPSDYCCWAYVLCKLAGDKMPTTWREWVAQHPDMTITGRDPADTADDETIDAANDPNHTPPEQPGGN